VVLIAKWQRRTVDVTAMLSVDVDYWECQQCMYILLGESAMNIYVTGCL